LRRLIPASRRNKGSWAYGAEMAQKEYLFAMVPSDSALLPMP
jgi:hypothetical protein